MREGSRIVYKLDVERVGLGTWGLDMYKQAFLRAAHELKRSKPLFVIFSPWL